MKETLISYDTAVLAKEKGFNEPVYYGYNNEKKLSHEEIWNYSCEGGMSLDEWLHSFNEENYDGYKYSAPTQSLLAKWFRDEHGIHVIPWCNASGWAWELEKVDGTHISIMDIDDDIEGTQPESGMFKIYEEALEAGLKEALKLIEA